jgi:16S rRNA (uracil1498-N3)-methyltransferase
MNLPFFYASTLELGSTEPQLEEDTMRHMMQVLRMQKGDALKLTNGRGLIADAVIMEASKKRCSVTVKHVEEIVPIPHRVVIAISPLKNVSRFEWFLEKAAETGISVVVPLLCSRTERQFIKKDRWNGILVSAMQQSQQAWLTELSEPLVFSSFVSGRQASENYIAHCMEGDKSPLQTIVKKSHFSSCILIGPEGDFTSDELSMALDRGYLPVSLGETRLRTETAGITAAVLLTHPV